MRDRILGMSAVVVALALVLGSPASAEKVDRQFHQAFDVQEGTKLVLHHGDGEVSITPWGKSTIDVEVIYRASIKKAGSGSVSDFEVEFEHSGDTVRVVAEDDEVVLTRGEPVPASSNHGLV